MTTAQAVQAHKRMNAYMVAAVIWGVPLLAFAVISTIFHHLGQMLIVLLLWCAEIYLSGVVLQWGLKWNALKKEMDSGLLDADVARRILEQIRSKSFWAHHSSVIGIVFIVFVEILSGWLFLDFIDQPVIPAGGTGLIVTYLFRLLFAVSTALAFWSFHKVRIQVVLASPADFEGGALGPLYRFVSTFGVASDFATPLSEKNELIKKVLLFLGTLTSIFGVAFFAKKFVLNSHGGHRLERGPVLLAVLCVLGFFFCYFGFMRRSRLATYGSVNFTFSALFVSVATLMGDSIYEYVLFLNKPRTEIEWRKETLIFVLITALVGLGTYGLVRWAMMFGWFGHKKSDFVIEMERQGEEKRQALKKYKW